MPSNQQIEASRENEKRSTGPTTSIFKPTLLSTASIQGTHDLKRIARSSNTNPSTICGVSAMRQRNPYGSSSNLQHETNLNHSVN